MVDEYAGIILCVIFIVGSIIAMVMDKKRK